MYLVQSLHAHCKYGVGTDPVYSFLLSRVLLLFYLLCVFVLPYVIFNATLILINALLGLELARKALHYICGRDINNLKLELRKAYSPNCH